MGLSTPEAQLILNYFFCSETPKYQMRALPPRPSCGVYQMISIVSSSGLKKKLKRPFDLKMWRWTDYGRSWKQLIKARVLSKITTFTWIHVRTGSRLLESQVQLQYSNKEITLRIFSRATSAALEKPKQLFFLFFCLQSTQSGLRYLVLYWSIRSCQPIIQSVVSENKELLSRICWPAFVLVRCGRPEDVLRPNDGHSTIHQQFIMKKNKNFSGIYCMSP